jgi:hypothetical protein
MVVKWVLRYPSPRGSHHTTLPELQVLVSLALNGNEGDGGEQKFPKVHSSWLGDVLAVEG